MKYEITICLIFMGCVIVPFWAAHILDVISKIYEEKRYGKRI